MTGSLQDKTVLVIGRGSGIARAVCLAARDAGRADHLSRAVAGGTGVGVFR
jgi:NAD(P)-dependent dehydrogenase (short-subunit alcohol dehydrogenase family)